VHSAIKRKSGSFVRSRIPWFAEKEIALKIIAYNIRRILIISNSIFIFIVFRFSTELFLIGIKSLNKLREEIKVANQDVRYSKLFPFLFV